MSWRKPRYACVYAGTARAAEAAPEHEQGPLIGVTRQGRLFACSRCGVLYWVPRPKYDSVDDGRCYGVTAQGKRCKLASAEGSNYCGNHRYLEEQSRLLVAELP